MSELGSTCDTWTWPKKNKRIKNLIGKRFCRLLVLMDSGQRQYGGIVWFCQCDCGNIIKARSSNLLSGRMKSCGCLKKQGKHGDNRPKSRTSLYSRWCAIKTRCFIQSCIQYHRYGERGIKVCPEWEKSYPTFKKWALSHGYAPHLTIDRIDNDKGYSPDNCQWITLTENIKKAHLK